MRIGKATTAVVATATVVASLFAATSTAFAATSNDTTQFSVTAGSLAFTTTPDAPNLPALTLNGQAQTLNATMGNFGVDDATGSAAGWNVTVSGDSSAGKSAVFKRYCTQAGGCTGDPFGYVAGGATLGAGSLTLSSTSASFSAQNGTTGTAPTHQCAAPCNVDVAPASPVKIISAAAGTGMGTWATTGYTATSLTASTPTTISVLPANEVFRVDLLWTLGSGP
jgi:hypothetical protein